jgi:hypothetical protein
VIAERAGIDEHQTEFHGSVSLVNRRIRVLKIYRDSSAFGNSLFNCSNRDRRCQKKAVDDALVHNVGGSDAGIFLPSRAKTRP